MSIGHVVAVGAAAVCTTHIRMADYWIGKVAEFRWLSSASKE